MSELQTPQAGDDNAPDTDVVSLLMRQHGDIRNLFDEVEAATGEERRDATRGAGGCPVGGDGRCQVSRAGTVLPRC
ncbi:hypothetical protein [Streptomyces mirabilis]|uniref:hypothetical protein n=1 Tax=Streptomyces mirabilis TaxID=68239 RepID=UPI0036A468D6